jgi:pimeloyl-ACP methyl ester carboxylesterase
MSRIAQLKAAPPARTASIGSDTLAYSVVGSGSPAIVLINGAGVGMLAWRRLYPAVAELGTVIAYDRPGVGGSSRSHEPQTGEAVVTSLHALLAETGVRPPYVLVGHSFGGLYANLFARLHPQDVGSVLFLEATAPEDIGAIQRHQGAAAKALGAIMSSLVRRDPNEEVQHENLTVAQIAAAPPFPALPVRVISGGKQPPSWLFSPAARKLRDEHQMRLAQLSPLGKRTIAARSGHFPQMSEPELVLRALAELCEAVR